MATKYVSPSGNDTTGTGLVGAPWQTLLKALNTVATGDTIQLRAGTYGTTFKGARDTVTIENYANEIAILQRTSAGSVLAFENSRNITIRRNSSGGALIVRSTVAGNGTSTGISVFMSGGGTPGFVPSGITIDGVTVENHPGWGIRIKNTSAAIVQNCDVSHCSIGVDYLAVTGASFIQDNVFHDMDRMLYINPDAGGGGIALNLGTNGTTVRRNIVFNCKAVSPQYGFDGGAVEFFGNLNCVVEDNVCFNNEGFLETGTNNATAYPTTGNIVRRNLIYGRLSYKTIDPTPGVFHRAGNLQFYNNTFDVDDGAALFTYQGAYPANYAAPTSGTKIKNNIFRSNNAATEAIDLYNISTLSGVECDYNLLYNSTGGSAVVMDANNYGGTRAGTALAAFQAASPFSDHDVWNADPVFVNRAARDYTLQAGSPAINVGAAIPGTTTGYVGVAPDMGRYEYASIPVPDVDANVNAASGTGSAKNAVVSATAPNYVQAAAGAASGSGSAYLGDNGPNAPVITYPAVNGVNTNGIVTISGTAESGVLVELFDGATSQGTTNAVGGSFSFTLPTVSAGAHTYTAKATNVANVVSGASNARVITVDLSTPTVSSIVPADNATGVAVSTNIVVTFSEALDPLTVTANTFVVTANGQPVAGALALSSGDTVVTFNPTADLPAGTVITVSLSSLIRDTSGNPLS